MIISTIISAALLVERESSLSSQTPGTWPGIWQRCLESKTLPNPPKLMPEPPFLKLSKQLSGFFLYPDMERKKERGESQWVLCRSAQFKPEGPGSC